MSNNENLQPGEPIKTSTEAPTTRARYSQESSNQPTNSEGYTSRGYVQHFRLDREVNLAKLNQALRDVYAEPGMNFTRIEFEIDRNYWEQISPDPWSGNVYKYSFRPPNLGEGPIINPPIFGSDPVVNPPVSE